MIGQFKSAEVHNVAFNFKLFIMYNLVLSWTNDQLVSYVNLCISSTVGRSKVTREHGWLYV